MSKNLQMAKAMRSDLFATRGSVKEAWDYAFEVMNALRPADRGPALTAMMVLMNTISKQIIENEERHPLTDAFVEQAKGETK